jgi:hypothetical protein
MTFLKTFIRRTASTPWLAEILAGLGAFLYVLQSAVYIHQIIPTLDEGGYLFKGYLFVTGVYKPYQDFGPLTNKMPLSFLIPGWVQAVFGPGLRSGRYFAILLGVLMLLGLWLAARRLSGHWWAAVVVWAVAIDPILVKMYAQALSEGLVAAMLPWVFFLLLGIPGSAARLWPLRVILGAVLLGIVVATRQNMIVMAPFVLAYIFWQYGRRAGWWGLAGFALPLLVFHALYWPNIMQVWLAWIPRGLLPFLDSLRPQLSGTPVWNPDTNLEGKLFSFWMAIRHHFIALVGALCTWLLWPKKAAWKSPDHFKAAVLLSVSLFVLTAAHAAAAFGADYCQSCFTIYLSFFSEIGLLLTALAFSAWEKKPSVVRQVVALAVTLVVAVGAAYAAMADLDPILMNLQAPRIRSGQLLTGSTQLWRLLSNKFSLSYDQLLVILPVTAGLLGGLLMIAVALLWGRRWRSQQRPHSRAAPGSLALLILFLSGVVFSPTLVLGGGDPDPVCGDVLAAYETAGAHLASLVPPGSLVFWNGGLAPVPLLYLPGVRIFPPQLNDGYARRIGGDGQQLYQHGYWNDELAQGWLNQSDFVLVEGWRYKGEMHQDISPAEFNELPATQPLVTCKDGAQIRIFRREP